MNGYFQQYSFYFNIKQALNFYRTKHQTVEHF